MLRPLCMCATCQPPTLGKAPALTLVNTHRILWLLSGPSSQRQGQLISTQSEDWIVGRQPKGSLPFVALVGQCQKWRRKAQVWGETRTNRKIRQGYELREKGDMGTEGQRCGAVSKPHGPLAGKFQSVSPSQNRT